LRVQALFTAEIDMKSMEKLLIEKIGTVEKWSESFKSLILFGLTTVSGCGEPCGQLPGSRWLLWKIRSGFQVIHKIHRPSTGRAVDGIDKSI